MISTFWIAALTAAIVGVANCAENAGTSIATGLMECYNTTELHERDYRLPATINVLIDLIRQAEDASATVDARVLSIQLIHRFRQDGIMKKTDVKTPGVLPFAPRGKQQDKNRVLLWKFLPGDAYTFPNKSLTAVERCGLHFMLSNSFDRASRGDEQRVCKRLGQYVRRPKRETEKFEHEDRASEVETVQRAYSELELSDCPVENGVVYTRWGAIQAGTVLAAIAAGYEPQIFEGPDYKLDSRHAITLAGDLAEVALIEGLSENTYSIGGVGGWNSTLAPHWYFIDTKEERYLTDPELRADLDGLIIAMNLKNWVDRYHTVKISQILDMYYSNRGVFSEDFKACKRNQFTSEYAPAEKLVEETKAFGILYNNYAAFDGSPSVKNIENGAEKVVEAYSRSITKIADVKCDEDDLNRIATDLIIVLDTSWNYNNIYPSLSYLLDNLDINKYESNYTVINAKDGSILVNASNSISKFHQHYNKSIHDTSAQGFDVYKIMEVVENIHRDRAESYKTNGRLSGKSSTVLLVARSSDSSQSSYLQERYTSVFDQFYPETHFILLGTGNKEPYTSFVRNAQDVFTLPEIISQESEVIITLNTLVKRLHEAPRRIVNPRCGGMMNGEASSNTMEVYVEPGTSNFYKIPVNYLTGEESKTVKIKAQNGGNITVCTSRSDPRPLSNCDSLGQGGEKVYDLTCTDGCSPFNFAIVGGQMKNSNVRCSDNGCRFPDNMKVSIQVEGLTCNTNNGSKMTTSLSVFIAFICVYFIKLY